MDPGYLDALRDLAGTRCQLSVLHVLAPEELDPEVPPDARLVDNETGQGIEVTGDDDLVERYRVSARRLASGDQRLLRPARRRLRSDPLRRRADRSALRRPAPTARRPVIVPLALLGLASLPIIIAFYMLRLRRRDVPVGSTFLWQQLVRDVEANAPWQRLRFSWLLVVQLLIAALLVLAAARPFLSVQSELAANVVLIVDTSASMGAVDPEGERIAAARAAARKVIGQLPVGGRVTVVAADQSAHVLVSETDDRAAALAAIDGIAATQLPGDLTDAFALASALAARDADSSVVVVTDATADRLPSLGIGAPIHVERVGSGNRNQAIAALSVMRRAGGAQLDLFVAVSNASSADATRRLEIYADGALVDARDMSVPAGQRSEALVSTVPSAAGVIEARLAGSDQLTVDDRAFALVPQTGAVRALLVSEGNSYLESALALLPRLELYAIAPDGMADALAAADKAGTPYGLLIFDRYVPPKPPRDTDPVRGADEQRSVRHARQGGRGAARRPHRSGRSAPSLRRPHSVAHRPGADGDLTEPMRPVVESTAGTPLLAAGRVDGQPLAVLTFALGESDLPLQVAFPLLVSNLTDFLLPAVDGVLPPSVALGVPIDLALDPSLPSATLVESGATTAIPLTGGHGTLPGADRVGIRELRDPAGATLGRVAANLFDPAESNIAPGDPRRLVEMGRVEPDRYGGAAAIARRVVVAARAARPGPALRGVAPLPPPHPEPAEPSPAPRRGGCAMIPLAFSDPAWLWLALPAVGLVAVGWLAAARVLPRGRRITSLVHPPADRRLRRRGAGRGAPGPCIGSAQRGLPGRRVGLNGRCDVGGSARLRPGGGREDARGRHRRGGGLWGECAGRSAALAADRAAGAGIGPGGRGDRHRGGRATGQCDLSRGNAATPHPPLRWERHIGTGAPGDPVGRQPRDPPGRRPPR